MDEYFSVGRYFWARAGAKTAEVTRFLRVAGDQALTVAKAKLD